MKRILIPLIVLAVMIASVSMAAASGDDSSKTAAPNAFHNNRPPPPPPPREAIDACANLEAGADCTFNMHGDTVTGKCRRGPDPDMPLACAPNDMPPPHPPCHPPREAIDACANLEAGADCTFDMHGDTVTGKCRRGPDPDMPLACAPNDMPPPPPMRRR